MLIEELKNKKIGILGLGVEGRAISEFLDKSGLSYEVFDKKDGDDYLQRAVDSCQILFRSPGVKVLEPVLVAAKKSGIIITSQIKFFFENCPAKIIGVTGTKGKGTTSQLIYNILQSAKIPSYLAGNIGVPAIDLLYKEQLQPDDYVILELSSFQLQDLEQSPHIAVVLMVTPEHFDYHSGMEEYVDAKSALTRYQKSGDYAVINSDYPPSMKIGKLGSAQKFYIRTLPADKVEVDPFKIYSPEEQVQIKNGVFAEELHGTINFVENGHLTKFMEIKDSQLRGFHNVQNISAAIMAARILNIKDQIIQDSVRAYKGLEHRLEFVTERNRIKFYNDSIATTPESSLAAIKAFTEPEIVIIGGADKQADYKKFATELARQKNIKALVMIGAIAPQLAEYLKEAGYAGSTVINPSGMQEVFSEIKLFAEPGDIVLLAPGTSSFGMFTDYKDRGNQFKKLAQEF